MRVTEKTIDRAAMRIYGKFRGIEKDLETRWEHVKDDSVTDVYRAAARACFEPPEKRK